MCSSVTEPTKAVVLAAGMGSRLRPITSNRPKPCVNVGPRPILAHQLHAYADAGIVEVCVVAGYRAADVREVCNVVATERPSLELSVIENTNYDETDNMYSLSLAKEVVGGDSFILSNGDVVFEPRIATRLASGTGSAIACDTGTYDEESMKITLDARGEIEHISKKVGEREADATAIDCYRFSAEFSSALFTEIDRRLATNADSWTEAAIDSLLREFAVEPVDIAGMRWVEIDDHADLAEADRTFSTLSPLGEKAAVFFDLDGTIYLGDELVSGAAEVVESLREYDASVYFLSNNSSGWKTAYAEKLRSLGIPATESDILLSTDGVIEYLHETGQTGAYVVGTSAMCEAMAEQGIAVESADPEVVVVGFDTELTYEKVRRATLAISGGSEFLLAHPDLVCPTAEGLVPDCGSIGALVETATGETPAHVFGKPDPAMLAPVLRERGLDSVDIAVVGDRLETEIRLADRLGCESVCVLTGDATRAAVEESSLTPTLVAESIADLAAFC